MIWIWLRILFTLLVVLCSILAPVPSKPAPYEPDKDVFDTAPLVMTPGLEGSAVGRRSGAFWSPVYPQFWEAEAASATIA
jgi:hypothetical protein